VLYLREVGERLGAQGTFGHNLLSQMEMDVRGISIAEGDVLVLSIRLFSELLIGRYSLPQPKHAEALLSRHSAAILSQCAAKLTTFQRGHRDEQFNNLILPQAEPAIMAQGCAYAHSCAVDAGVPSPLLHLFELVAIKLDPAWYSEHAGITNEVRLMKEDKAIREALPHLRQYADGMHVRKWISAPIISDESWDKWYKDLVARNSYTGYATHEPSDAMEGGSRGHPSVKSDLGNAREEPGHSRNNATEDSESSTRAKL